MCSIALRIFYIFHILYIWKWLLRLWTHACVLFMVDVAYMAVYFVWLMASVLCFRFSGFSFYESSIFCYTFGCAGIMLTIVVSGCTHVKWQGRWKTWMWEAERREMTIEKLQSTDTIIIALQIHSINSNSIWWLEVNSIQHNEFVCVQWNMHVLSYFIASISK